MTDTAETQAEDLIVSIMDLTGASLIERPNAQPTQLYYAKARALEGKTRDFEKWERDI